MGLRRSESRKFAVLAIAALLAALAAGCRHQPALDVLPLINGGMSYDTVRQLKSLDMTQPEAAQLAEVHNAGLSDSGCVELLKALRSRGQQFTAGDVVAGLLEAGMAEQSVLELARMNELGLDAGEFQAMRLAGLSDTIILTVASRRVAHQPVLSGASLATLQNAGLRAGTLLELARRGVPDSESRAILRYRRRGASDRAILRRFAGA